MIIKTSMVERYQAADEITVYFPNSYIRFHGGSPATAVMRWSAARGCHSGAVQYQYRGFDDFWSAQIFFGSFSFAD
jgi:hypothetical protein